jgi:hypothetical protein
MGVASFTKVWCTAVRYLPYGSIRVLDSKTSSTPGLQHAARGRNYNHVQVQNHQLTDSDESRRTRQGRSCGRDESPESLSYTTSWRHELDRNHSENRCGDRTRSSQCSNLTFVTFVNCIVALRSLIGLISRALLRRSVGYLIRKHYRSLRAQVIAESRDPRWSLGKIQTSIYASRPPVIHNSALVAYTVYVRREPYSKRGDKVT